MTSSIYFAARLTSAYPLLLSSKSLTPFTINVNADLFQSILEAVFIPLFGPVLGPLSLL